MRTHSARAPPQVYKSRDFYRDFYQVVPIDDILFSVPIWPADLWDDLTDPARFLLNEHGWGMQYYK